MAFSQNPNNPETKIYDAPKGGASAPLVYGEQMFWKKEKSDDDMRDKSWRVAKKLGYPTNPLLPPLESNLRLRPIQEIHDRILLLNVACAHAYGLKQSKAKEWIKSENLEQVLSPAERAFIFDGDGEKSIFKSQVETIWAFLWIMNMIKDLKFDKHCNDNLVKIVPDLKNMEPSAAFRKKTTLRPEVEVVTMLDLVYCLHWGQRQYNLEKGTWKYPPTIVEERRKALEWSLSDIEWDNITLDT